VILLAGAFGQGNPGDEALLHAFIAALPDHDTVTISSAPAATAAEHGIPAVHREDVLGVLRAIRLADAVVIAGGTVFKTLHPSCGRRPGALLRRVASLAAAAKLQRKPLALVGVGAGDLRSRPARILSRAVIEAADLLILRDEESADRLAAAGATAPFRVGADAAWTVLDDAPANNGNGHAAERVSAAVAAGHEDAAVRVRARGAARRAIAARRFAPPRDERPHAFPAAHAADLLAAQRPPIVVALSHLAGGPELTGVLAAELGPVAATGEPLLLQPWQPEDVELGRALEARLDGARLVPAPADLAAARDAFAGARLVIGLRFHALVAAAAAGVPFVAYAHEPKHAGLARRFAQPAVDPGGPLAETVLAALDAAPHGDAAAAARERELAEEGFRLLRVLVSGGRSEEAIAIAGLPLRPEEWLA
jgi:polysaccharide pyruvyl transferase WcaK-like protein